MSEQTVNNNTQALWLRILSAAALFLFVGALYFISWAFWSGMSHWADKYPNMGYTADQFYLTYIWGPILLVLLIVPTILTLTHIRWFLKIFYWILSFILAFITWIVWFGVIEATSK